MRGQKGFSSSELLIVVFMVMFLFFVLSVPTWNCFYTKDGVFEQLRDEGYITGDSAAIRTERNIFRYSRIYVRNGVPSHLGVNSPNPLEFRLDTNVLFNYRLTPASVGEK